jgi:GNAT superfamily N-acetyltransferase
MGTIAVRQAVLSDLEALATLFDQYRQFQGQPADLPAARSFLHERFNHGESVAFIAIDRGGSGNGNESSNSEVPAGFAQLYPSFSSVSLSRVFILNDLFVAERGRRKGVASALLGALEAYAWAFNASRVSLNVARSNVPAQQLYLAQGWTADDQFFMFHRFPP